MSLRLLFGNQRALGHECCKAATKPTRDAERGTQALASRLICKRKQRGVQHLGKQARQAFDYFTRWAILWVS